MDEDLEYVGFWLRAGASIVDGILIGLVTIPMVIGIYGAEYFATPQANFIAGPADFFISYVLPMIVGVWCWIKWGATPGKAAIGAKVVDARTGQRISVGQAVIRYLGYYPAMLVAFLGILWVGFDPRKQGWHDKLAGTVVVRSRNRHVPVRFSSDRR
jgi:uncharacterized RDD family membrane protein YckC